MLIELTQSALQGYFGAVCTAPIFLAHKNLPTEGDALSGSEIRRMHEISSEKRRADFLLGRQALKDALANIGRDSDTSLVTWPSPYCSLSHSEGHAVAVSSASTSGIGIDVQLNKFPAFAVADRILSEQTLEYWQQLPEADKAKALQRLWTANEAVYKACPAPQPAYFSHYRLHTPDLMESIATIDNSPYRFIVYSAELANGCISLAIRK